MKFSVVALFAVSLFASVHADELVDKLKQNGVTVQVRLKAPSTPIGLYTNPIDATVVSGKITDTADAEQQHYVGTLADNRIEWYFQIKDTSPAEKLGAVMGSNVKILMKVVDEQGK
jgi:hypothetical protein